MKIQVRFLKLAIFIILIVLLQACSSEKANVVKEFEDALNRHDIQEILTYYDRDVTIVMGGVSQNVDREQMQPLAEWDKVVDSYVRFDIREVSGDTVKCTKTETNEWYRLFGIDSVYFETWDFIIEEGKITKMMTRLTMRSQAQMGMAMGNFMKWLRQDNPELVEELIPKGQPQFGAESAQRWMDLLRQWREAVDTVPEA